MYPQGIKCSQDLSDIEMILVFCRVYGVPVRVPDGLNKERIILDDQLYPKVILFLWVKIDFPKTFF